MIRRRTALVIVVSVFVTVLTAVDSLMISIAAATERLSQRQRLDQEAERVSTLCQGVRDLAPAQKCLALLHSVERLRDMIPPDPLPPWLQPDLRLAPDRWANPPDIARELPEPP